jgi:hypothetical protein
MADDERTMFWFFPVHRVPNAARFGRAVATNPPLAITLGIAAAFVVKVWAVSNGSTTTALALIRTASTATVVAGLAVVAIPTLLLYAISYFSHMTTQVLNARETTKAGVWIFPTILLLVIAIFSSVTAALIMAAGLVFVVLISGIQWKVKPTPAGEDTPSKATSRTRGRVMTALTGRTARALGTLLLDVCIAVLLVGLAFVFVLNDTPWMPAERIDQGKTDTVGYVIQENDQELVVLVEQTRQVIRIDRHDIDDRVFCQVKKPSSSDRPLLAMLGHRDQTTYPLCDPA